MTQGPAWRDFTARRPLALILLAVACWFVVRPYQGLSHDASLYALQALGRLAPASLGLDVFLRFGSQDAYTAFTPLYGVAIGLLGVEDAARLLTFIGHLWWMAAVGWLSIRWLGLDRGLLAVALIAALPGYYGAWQVFRYAEPFLTPRLYSEAAVLTGLALLVSGRRLPALGSMLLSMAIHPLLGFAGLLLWAGMAVPQRLALALPALVLAGTFGAVAVAAAAPHYPLSFFDPGWLELVRQRSPFLSMRDWNGQSFQDVVCPLAALWIFGRAWPDDAVRRVLQTTLGVALLGLAVTLVGATVFDVVLITQGQAWRWTWLAMVLVVIAAVSAVPQMWARPGNSRTVLLLLLVSWLLSGWPAVVAAALAVALHGPGGRLSGAGQRYLQLAGTALCLTSVFLWLDSIDWSEPAAMLRWTSATGLPGPPRLLAHGVPAVVLVTSLYWATGQPRLRWPVLALATALAAAAAVPGLADWLRTDYASAANARVEAWQRAIPPSAEVFWPDDPRAAWFLLGRRVYISADQTAGILFTPRAASEMASRVREVALILPPAFAFRASIQGRIWPATVPSLAETCRRSEIDFVVSRELLSLPRAAPPLTLTDRRDGAIYPVYLYRCADDGIREAANLLRGDSPR